MGSQALATNDRTRTYWTPVSDRLSTSSPSGGSPFATVFQVNGNTLSLALFTDATNSKELLDSMQAGTLNHEVAFLNASLIPDVFPVLAATHKTLISKSRESLTTRTLHSNSI
ncbi:protein CYPRO4-like [Hibiscus syriacus]|uniref:Protein CYPRO4-like n=1 Tax=Hibiscus syriacus TaxID=106335 RepID=A0A6A2YHT3_HIBSY|nr:uncharacterized protein LOC120139288 [Hibiscus syriacus]XP_039026736.1 uncharacterized protein LOC120160388 [Hibiscus syriacus]XP_039026991.1 uncharacterized protein LOC120160704 [Hibiscus syriacus]KAE8679986.1 protein CYPRO4-like [Hibiscus syriacus]